ncbi:hypothetical protein [uncultured Aquincola sp.]|uniref:hypothetical protein n=1 Tax=uncultured Aquincola sp. TaxID=886556 RepID=UPI0032B1AACF
MRPGRHLTPRRWPHWLRALVLACLTLALPLYGSSAATLKLLGPSHRHQAVALQAQPEGPTEGLLARLLGPRLTVLLNVWQQQLQHAAEQAHHAHAGHHHSAWLQHHHDAHDPSVVTQGASTLAADGADEAALGSATLPLAPAYALRLPATAARRQAWPRPPRRRWRHRAVPRLERPPQAG